MALTDCGVRPMCAITGMPASTSSRICSYDRSPPSSLTAPAPASLISRVADRSACTGPSWYEPKGRSATIRAREVPRTTAAESIVISSRVTGTVDSYPRWQLPAESPTSMTGMPASSKTDAVIASYAVSMGHFSPRSLARAMSRTVIRRVPFPRTALCCRRRASSGQPRAASWNCSLHVISRRPYGVPGSPPWWHFVSRSARGGGGLGSRLERRKSGALGLFLRSP